MKSVVLYFLSVALLLLLFPLSSLRQEVKTIAGVSHSTLEDRPTQTLAPDKTTASTKTKGTTSRKTTTGTTTTGAETLEDVFRVSLSDGIVSMTATDFLRYVVTCEMPLSYPEEALKAQAVASYTYFSYRRNEARKAGKKADFSDVPQYFEETCSEEKMKKRLGNQYAEYNQKVTKAVQDVTGYTVRYDGKLILAAYHAINSGVTASAEEVWNTAYPYLVSVASPSDRTASDAVKRQVLSAAEVKTALETLPKVTLSDRPEEWFSETKRFSSGLIRTIKVGDTTQSGSDVRYALGLRSAHFTVSYAEQQFTFTVTGYGHGVGMSQSGACGMAKQGSTWQEILKHYYTGVTIEKA